MSNEAWFLIDEDGDCWWSEDGELFTCHYVGENWRESTVAFRDYTLDRIEDNYGIVDDGIIIPTVTIPTPINGMKDSGERETYESGMLREPEAGKPRFDLIIPEGVPFDDQFLTRIAVLMAKGAAKYADRNWEKADGPEELARMKSAAFRHFIQWFTGETDEDHAAAVVFNLLAHETTALKVAA